MGAQGAMFESRFHTASDGLRLHLRDYGDRACPLLPVVCLPGLARTAGDFDCLARHLAREGRRVIAIDYRGRGLSDRDSNWRNYDVFVESADIQTQLTGAGVGEAVFIGTSRGVLHIFLLAALRPGAIRAAILNDMGPVLEAAGLARLRGYVGRMPTPTSWSDAVDLVKRIFAGQFTNVAAQDWETWVRLTFEEKGGRLVPQYDPALMRTLDLLDLEAPLPVLWPQFHGLRNVPLLAIRGANSDMLTQATLDAMTARHPDCTPLVVPGQGHAPLLMDEATINRIAAFVASQSAR